MDDELRRSAVEHVRTQVGRGAAPFLDVVEDTLEYLHGQGDDPDEKRAMIWSAASDEFAAAIDAQGGWPERTDNDRLDAAFRALDEAGIVARQDFACCQNCGVTEIGGTVPDARGYVFYHQQDTDRAVDGGGVWLAFGLFEQPPTVEIGTEIADAMTAEGLTVNWERSAGQRIHVPLDWAVRRHGRLAVFGPPVEPPRDIVTQVVEGANDFRRRPVPSAEQLSLFELPWLPAGVRLRIRGEDLDEVVIRREFDRLHTDDGRVAGRFDGLRLLRGEPVAAPSDEPGLLEVRYDDGRYHPDVPMTLPETLAVLRRMPTADTWLSAMGRGGRIVQMNWPNGEFRVESPNPDDQTSTGGPAPLADAERLLAILATEDRVAIHELPGVRTEPW